MSTKVEYSFCQAISRKPGTKNSLDLILNIQVQATKNQTSTTLQWKGDCIKSFIHFRDSEGIYLLKIHRFSQILQEVSTHTCKICTHPNPLNASSSKCITTISRHPNPAVESPPTTYPNSPLHPPPHLPSIPPSTQATA